MQWFKRMLNNGILIIWLGVLLSGCVTKQKPEPFFQLSPESAKRKALQSRVVDASTETEIISASAAVLQDLGFQIEESVFELGVLNAVKERSAREYGQEISQVLILLLSILGRSTVIIPVDLHQQIAAILFVSPVEGKTTRFSVRIMFYRKLWQGEGQSGNNVIPPGRQKMEMIYAPKIYQQFFAKLSKSLFLEIQQI